MLPLVFRPPGTVRCFPSILKLTLNTWFEKEMLTPSCFSFHFQAFMPISVPLVRVSTTYYEHLFLVVFVNQMFIYLNCFPGGWQFFATCHRQSCCLLAGNKAKSSYCWKHSPYCYNTVYIHDEQSILSVTAAELQRWLQLCKQEFFIWTGKVYIKITKPPPSITLICLSP